MNEAWANFIWLIAMAMLAYVAITGPSRYSQELIVYPSEESDGR